MVASDGKSYLTTLTTFTWLLPEGFTRDPQHNNAFDIRVVTIDGNPWFVAVDAYNALGLRQWGGVLNGLDTEEKTLRGRTSVGLTPGRDIRLISESGLYKLIMRSDKPQAKPFQDWVTKVVPPSRTHLRQNRPATPVSSPPSGATGRSKGTWRGP